VCVYVRECVCVCESECVCVCVCVYRTCQYVFHPEFSTESDITGKLNKSTFFILPVLLNEAAFH
jgi:hypothetical protein